MSCFGHILSVIPNVLNLWLLQLLLNSNKLLYYLNMNVYHLISILVYSFCTIHFFSTPNIILKPYLFLVFLLHFFLLCFLLTASGCRVFFTKLLLLCCNWFSRDALSRWWVCSFHWFRVCRHDGCYSIMTEEVNFFHLQLQYDLYGLTIRISDKDYQFV